MQHKIVGEISIIKEFKDKVCLVHANIGELQQVILNLLSNALDFIDDHGIIRIKTLNEADKCTICIEDNGSGIPKEHLNKVFEPFFTTKTFGQGTGLGLSMVYSIIKKHHGEIKIESEVDQGTKVTLSIPNE